MRIPYAPLCLAAALAAPSAAQSPHPPAVKIARGFATLPQGSWAQALAEWNQDGMLAEDKLEEGRTGLEKVVPSPRSIGEWAALRPPVLQHLWQRHWVMATFDRGAVFLVLDYVWHRGEWRLLRLQPVQDPRGILPNLDAPPPPPERN